MIRVTGSQWLDLLMMCDKEFDGTQNQCENNELLFYNRRWRHVCGRNTDFVRHLRDGSLNYLFTFKSQIRLIFKHKPYIARIKYLSYNCSRWLFIYLFIDRFARCFQRSIRMATRNKASIATCLQGRTKKNDCSRRKSRPDAMFRATMSTAGYRFPSRCRLTKLRRTIYLLIHKRVISH